MRRTEQSSLILAAGVWVSLGVHVVLALGFSRLSAGLTESGDPPSTTLPRPVQPPEPPVEPPKPPPERELRLGVAAGDPATLTWLGFKEATEHQARQGMVEQSAMSLDPGRDAEAPAEGATEPSPNPDLNVAKSADEKALTRSEPEQVPQSRVDREALERLAARVRAAAREASDATEQVIESVQQFLEPPAEPIIPAQPAPTQPVTEPQVAPATPPRQSIATGQGTPGLESDRESIAVAVKNAPGVRPGKVLAAEGLEILTRQPRFAVSTVLTRRPRNPTVAVTFGRDGRVVRASFVSDGRTVYSTGDESIDQPLLNAIYSWTARGDALKELDPKDPQAGIRVMFTILLGG